jgi:isoleucyl-tRNA synthetase
MKPAASKPDFISLEHRVLDFWNEIRVLDRLREIRKDAPPFRFVDGPITANNPMGVHHAWGRTLKDVFIRYKTRNGHSCRFQNGFDCQGLWVEVEVEKALGFRGKPDIEAYGLDRFAEACKGRVEKFAKVISDQSIRLGQMMDWDHSYYTHTDENILGIWHFLKKCSANGWLYRSHLPMPWCPRCGTSLSEHEMAGSYKEMEHQSIFAQVPIVGDPSRRLLLWTTTPWTLPANVAAAVHPDLDYVEVSAPELPWKLVLGKENLKALGTIRGKIERTFKGAELVGLRYETFFPDFAAQKGVEHRVVGWTEVLAAEGTGIVHIAPGCGLEDFELGKTEGLVQIAPVDESGNFLAGFGELTGKNASAVAQEVADALQASGKLLRTEMYRHNYPHCWRCKGELIFRLVGEWFISAKEIRPRMIDAARTVKWKPEHVGKRMENWLENMGDWCISRKRYWGLPLPFFVCGCGKTEVIGSREELRARAIDPAKVDALPELHRPWIDEISIRCSACNEVVPRVVEVGDCWLDAGIVPYSTQGAFTNPEEWKRQFPVEWVCEMQEQVRLWFYSMLFMGVTISDCSPYEQVLAYERVISEEGTKFSKTGYMIHFDEAVEKMGADVMRYLFCGQPVTSELRFGYGTAEIAWRKLASLWNIYAFFVTYALVDDPKDIVDPKVDELGITDRWLLARTARFVSESTGRYEEQSTAGVVREFEEFAEDVSNWYVRVSRRRFWRKGEEADKRAAYGVLYRALKSAAQVMSPIIPFFAEEIWQNVVRSIEPAERESIHCSDWTEIPASWGDEGLLARTAEIRKAISLALELREKAGLRVRQPLPKMYVLAPGKAEAFREQASLVQSELNVKAIEVVEAASSFRGTRLALDFKKAGPVLKGQANAVKAWLEGLDVAACLPLVAKLDAGEPLRAPGIDVDLPGEIFVRKETTLAGYAEASDGPLTVALDTSSTPELVREGLARDLVRLVQTLRKEAGLEITDRIELALAIDAAEMRQALDEHRAWIEEEVLATKLIEGALDGATGSADWTIQGHEVKAGIRKAV